MAQLGTKTKTSVSTPEVEKKVEIIYPNKDEKGSVNLEGYPVFMHCALLDGSPEGAEKEYDAFVQYPQRPYQDKEGNIQWAKIAGIPSEEARQKVLDVVLHCFEKMDNGEDVGNEYEENGIVLKFPKLNPSPKKENILMNFSLNIIDLPVYINDLTVRTRPDGTYWTAFPRRPYEKDGERKWAPIAGPADSETNKVITEALVEAINSK